jgi:alpha-1,2-mannosyltransferase
MGYDRVAVTVLRTMVAEPEPRTGRHGLDLARDAGLSSGALYPALVRLERAGLVGSERGAGGRRRYLLTADGVTAIDVEPRPAAPATAWWWLLAALAAVQSCAALLRPADDRLADLAVYVGAVAGLRHGASLYDYADAAGAPFTYPPFAGLLLAPLASAATVPLRLGWTAATLVAVLVTSVLVARAAAEPWRGRSLAISAVLLLSAPVVSNLRFGQVSYFLAALVLVDVLVLRRYRWHGVLIGLAAAVKLTPLIFIPMLWLAGRRRPATVAAATFTACALLAWAVLPADSWRFWGTELWRVNRLGPITSVGNQSVNGALLRLGVDGAARSVLVLAVAGSVAALALWRAGRLGRSGDWLSATVVVGAGGVVLSPVSWTHHQIWLVLAALLPVRGGAWARRAWIAGVVAVMLLPVTALGPPLWSNARVLAAIAIAALVPLRPADDGPATR